MVRNLRLTWCSLWPESLLFPQSLPAGAIGDALDGGDYDLEFFLFALRFGQQNHLHGTVGFLKFVIKGAGFNSIVFAGAPGQEFGRLVRVRIEFTGNLAGDNRNRERNGRLDADAHGLTVAVSGERTVGLEGGGNFEFFPAQLNPGELRRIGQVAVAHAFPAIRRNAHVIRNALIDEAGDGSCGAGDDRAISAAVIAQYDDARGVAWVKVAAEDDV